MSLSILLKSYWNLPILDRRAEHRFLSILLKSYWNKKGGAEYEDYRKFLSILLKSYWNGDNQVVVDFHKPVFQFF